jgi:auxin responsive GH3 family protein
MNLCEPSFGRAFEFLPVHKKNGATIIDLQSNDIENTKKVDNELVDMVDVKFGHYYELLVTTYANMLMFIRYIIISDV